LFLYPLVDSYFFCGFNALTLFEWHFGQWRSMGTSASLFQ